MAYSPSTQQQGGSTKLQLYHLPLSTRGMCECVSIRYKI
uniref:Uncharacterized protein n=1 Tax=Medicago truncatula TaxID=3880 RepID=A2Q2K2_MEDTR|nr:hypothetical protein MtrDRAFT_AC151000g30v2 [Medicago truncatula]